jgi:hypothetical protein
MKLPGKDLLSQAYPYLLGPLDESWREKGGPTPCRVDPFPSDGIG